MDDLRDARQAVIAADMPTFKRICIYGGARAELPAEYLNGARELGAFLAQKGIGVVTGAGRFGMMGAVTDGALEAGGEVIGIIPERLRGLEQDHPRLSELFVVDSMHARKMMMATLSDAFIALPGGWGTLEEVFEVTTWNQLNYHRKPVAIYNICGFYDALLEHVARAAEVGFIRPVHRQLLGVASSPEEALAVLARAEIPDLGRWLDKP